MNNKIVHDNVDRFIKGVDYTAYESEGIEYTTPVRNIFQHLKIFHNSVVSPVNIY